MLAVPGVIAPTVSAFAGTWTQVVAHAPSGVDLMLLLPDGTVMCAKNDGSTIGNGWYRLTPDIHGSYVNGTWTTLASALHTRLYYPSQVTRDGRVFIAGGEYGTGSSFAEIYDPLTNVWTDITPSPAPNFYDCNSEITPDGQVLVMPVFPITSGAALRYNPATNTWSSGGHLAHGTYQDEATWVKLRDDSILTIDPFGTQSERYIPSTNTWVSDSNVPVSLYDPFGSELGASFILPNGNAFFLGSTGHTALYAPTGTPSPGVWTAGPDIPGSHGTPDAPACMMVTGNILCAVSPVPTSGNHFPSPTTFYEYDPVANSFSSVGSPSGASPAIGAPYATAMLALPDGSVLFSHFSNQLFVYTPSGTPLPAGKPTITGLTANGDGSYHLVGTGFNGLSEGANYGDDKQMFSNYPLVRLTDGSGNVYYARSYNWSGTSVQTGLLPTTTEFRPPASLPPGTYNLVVVANGFPSDPITFPPTNGFTPICFGDGTATVCPCFNNGAPAHGCDNSIATGGALLTGVGTASLSADTVTFTSSAELPNSLSVVLQGDALIPPAVFGDGLRCAGGALKRLYTKNAVAGTVIAPGVGDPSVSSQSSALGDTIPVGGTRIYQVYYRDPNLVFCAGGFNASQGITVIWGS